MQDIPNYIGIPVGLVATVIVSIATIIYQQDILEYVNARKAKESLKRKNTSIEFYKDLKKMREDPHYLSFKIKYSEYSLFIYSLNCLISLVFGVGFLENSSRGTLHMVAKAFDSKANDTNIDVLRHIEEADIKDAIEWGYACFIIGLVAIFLAYKKLAHIKNVMKTLAAFDDFEAKIKEKWPDALQETKTLL